MNKEDRRDKEEEEIHEGITNWNILETRDGIDQRLMLLNG